MKIIIGIIMGCLFGLLVGGWGPQRELNQSRLKVRQLEEEARTGGKRTTELGVITDLLSSDHEDSRQEELVSDPNPVDPADPDGVNDTVDETPADEIVEEIESSGSMEEEIEKAVELWKVRSELARSAFVSNAELDKAEAIRFDVLMEAMNIRLATSVESWADKIKRQGRFDEEDGIRMLNEFSEALVVTYDEMDRNFEQDWRMRAGNDLSLPDLIDPEVMKPLIRVEGLIEEGGGGNW